MDNQMDNSRWNTRAAVGKLALPLQYQPLDQMSFSDGNTGSSTPEWLRSTKNSMRNATTSSDSRQYRPNMTSLPSSPAKETSIAQHVGKTYTPDIELLSIVKQLMEKVQMLEEK